MSPYPDNLSTVIMSQPSKNNTMIQCTNCKEYYEQKWMKTTTPNHCLFCEKFLPMRDTYTTILQNMNVYFLNSGEYDRESFYPEFIDNLKKWTDYYHVFPTQDDLKTIDELCKVKNWTRTYWH
jgi:hypothetical protein